MSAAIRIAVLEAAVLKAAQTFEAYAAIHAEKGSVLGAKKAAFNQHLADEMRACLTPASPPPARQ